LDFAALDEVIMGCVLPAGLGQAPARQAALAAGIPVSVPCTTVNKMCGSGMKAVMLAADALRAGTAGLALAGGMESMSNAPHLLPGLRRGLRLGEAPLLDHMLHDGLRDPWEGESMGWYAEACADLYGFTRAEQDAYAALSVRRARAAQASGAFAAECVPVPIQAQGKGEAQTEVMMVTEDEEPGRCVHERIPHLKPAFRRAGGTVTAASSAGIADGAAALLLGTRAAAARWGLRPLARIRGQASHAGPPAEFPIAPIGAIRALLAQVGWSVGEVDLFEINEAFAVVVLAALRDLGGDLGLDPARVNVHGGACALGHPIGATGARILVTLLHALRRTGGRRGVATLCIGGGEATAMAIELLD
jgi:acetyl-CoA C-acetyltransferase